MITNLPNNHIGITVSPIAFNFRLGKSERLKGKLFASCPVTSGFTYELPPGKYEIIGLGSELTDEQIADVSEDTKPVYEQSVKYGQHHQDISDWYNRSSQRRKDFESILSHNKLEASKILILKKVL